MLNMRIKSLQEIVENLSITSVLDVGCRDCSAKNVFNESIEYYGNDLYQNETNSVAYVGDALELNLNRKFDCVISLDVLEHLDNPYELMDKLFDLSSRYVIVSLPNIYDLLHKYRFVFKDQLSGKYTFKNQNQLDRHRWIMNITEINVFYSNYEKKYNAKTKIINIPIAKYSKKLHSKLLVKIIGALFGRNIITTTVVCVFEKNK